MPLTLDLTLPLLLLLDSGFGRSSMLVLIQPPGSSSVSDLVAVLALPVTVTGGAPVSAYRVVFTMACSGRELDYWVRVLLQIRSEMRDKRAGYAGLPHSKSTPRQGSKRYPWTP